MSFKPELGARSIVAPWIRIIAAFTIWLAVSLHGLALTRMIASGDLLKISVDESPDLDGIYTVAGDGTIDFRYAGRISIEGMTIETVAQHIKKVLESSLFKHATVSVEISDYVGGNILILGAVRNPGSIPYKGSDIITLLEAIIGSGGMTERAASDQVKIFRWKSGGSMGREVINVDVKKIMTENDFSRDQYLRPRDIVVVPEMGQEDSVSEFLALGEFGKTGFHPVSDKLNMIRAVTLAGGVNQDAQLDSARILRHLGDGDYTIIPVDLARLFGSADMSMNVIIYPGDIIYVPSAMQASGGRVYFLGDIENPGMYPLPVSGIDATLARTILRRGGLNKFSNSSAVKIQRKSPDGSRQTLTFDVEKILKSGDFDLDLPLQDEDVIIIPQKYFGF